MHIAQYTFLDLLNNRVGTCSRSPNVSRGIIQQTVACVLRYHLRCAPEETVRLEASMSIRGNFESHIHLHIQSLSSNVQYTVVIVESLHKRIGDAQLS